MCSRVLTAAGVVAFACSVLACSPGAESSEKTNPRVPVTVAIVERKDSPVEIRTIGAVQPYSANP